MNKFVDHGLVSIIMPNYNGAKYIKETIESVIAQTYTNWEVLLVDDCSTDNSIEIAKSYNEPRIRILKNPTNQGAAASRNYALREAKGKWVAFLDADDLWTSEKLEKQLAFMVENDYRFSCASYEHINEQSAPLGIRVISPKKINKRKMYRYCYLGCLTVMYDAELVGLIQVDERLKSRNDYAMWLKVCKVCSCYYLDEVLAKYRIRTNSLSHSGLKKSIKNQYRMFRIGEKMCAIRAMYHTMINLFFGFCKKLLYVKKTGD